MNWIDANGVALRYELLGTEGPVLVLVHEMGGTLESWDGVAPLLAKKRRILRFDTRGAGLSEKIAGDVTLETMAADVAALLDAVEILEPVSIAGCAVGGAIALRFALDYPQRVASVIVLNPAADAPGEAGRDLMLRAETVRKHGMRSIETMSLHSGYPAMMRERDPARYRRFRARWLANDPVSLGYLFRMLARTDIIPLTGNIKAPTLALAGVHDQLRPPAYVRSVVKAIADHEVIEVDAAHHVPDQAPDSVARHLTAFLDRVHPARNCPTP